jgi:hypothetical protein
MTITDHTAVADDLLREQAMKRLKKKQDLQGHLLVYLLVNALLWAIWALTDGGFAWPVVVSLGWGIGLVMNVWDVYVRRPIGEAEVRRQIERLRQG